MSEFGKPEIVVITGASAGVGRATAQAFGREGARVALLARGEEGLEGARRDVEAAGGKALVIPTDVADPEQVEAAAARVEEELGPIDIWVNNAMVSVFSPFKEMTADEFRRVNEVTYLGYVYGTMSALKRMLPRDAGVIVQVGSALAYRGIPLQSAYCGAKHAIQGFSESVRAELIHDKSKVRITMVQMPALNTPQFSWVKSRLPGKPRPVAPIYQPEVAAEAILWAAHNDSREVNVGLSTTVVLWGNKLIPGFGDWYLAKTGYKGQQSEEPVEPNRRDNLWEPVPEDRGAHGDFDEQASESSPHLRVTTTHRRWLAVAGVGLVGATVAMRGRRR